MKYHEPSGLWFPDNEPRPQKMYDGLMKYVDDMQFLLSLVPPKARKRACVQAGGHVGLWPLRLAPRFRKIYTFECDPLAFEALARNVQGREIAAYPYALGERRETKNFSYYTGRTAVGTMEDVKAEGDLMTQVQVVTIDELEEDVAAIVLDIEGYEPWALRGARETIERCRPLIMCEMLRKSAAKITSTLAEMDYLPIDNPINRKCRDVVFAYGGRA